MPLHRKIAIVVGVLFIIGTAAGVLSVLLTNPILTSPDYLIKSYDNQEQMIFGALLVLVMGISLALVPVAAFPIFRKLNEFMAVGYLLFRGALEMFTYLASALCLLGLYLLGREYALAGRPPDSYFSSMGGWLLGVDASVTHLMVIVFSLGALMLYYLLYQTQLIPRWLSAWGLIAILLHFSTAFLMLFGIIDDESPLLFAINFPIFLQEMVMAVWLIVKGFNPAALPAEQTASGSAGLGSAPHAQIASPGYDRSW